MYQLPFIDPIQIDRAPYEAHLKDLIEHRPFEKVVILDDDPTGIQTIHDLYVYTRYDQETLKRAFLDSHRAFFILTNSRSLFPEETALLHQEITKQLWEVSQELCIPFQLISRTDSTLRQHYPLETQIIHDHSVIRYDGEILIPALFGGGRVTVNDVHYVIDNDQWIPVNQTDYAQDKSFGFQSCDLKDWIQEKTKGRYRAESVTSISLNQLRNGKIDEIVNQLNQVRDFNKVIVNAVDPFDLTVFTIALYQSLNQGKRFLYRTSASFINAFVGCDQSPYLKKDQVIDSNNHNGGLVVIGSHVSKTTRQLARLLESNNNIAYIEFDQHLVLSGLLNQEVHRVKTAIETRLLTAKTVVVSTRRERLDFEGIDPANQLALTREIAYGLMTVVKDLKVLPRFLIAKGGITSSDIGTKSLNVSRALVIGQIATCIPVWRIEEGKYNGLPYIIFPGNIGSDDTLADIVDELTKETP